MSWAAALIFGADNTFTVASEQGEGSSLRKFADIVRPTTVDPIGERAVDVGTQEIARDTPFKYFMHVKD
jgi:hypothetical protein